MNSNGQHSANTARRAKAPARGGSALTTAFVSVSLGAAALGGGALYLQGNASALADAAAQGTSANGSSATSQSDSQSAAGQSSTATQGLVSSSTSGSAAQSHTTGS